MTDAGKRPSLKRENGATGKLQGRRQYARVKRQKSLTLLALETRIRTLVDEHIRALRAAGADVNDKESIRAAHDAQRRSRLREEQAFREAAWLELSQYFADGVDVSPMKIRPRLELVEPRSWQARLFRLATLTWSVPVSRGYGRRIRFLVWDDHNSKLIGVIGLTDPVFNLAARDSHVAWSLKQRRRMLINVMDAFVLGAIPPYSMLLGGKLVASLLRTREVRDAFARRYHERSGKISKRRKFPRLVMITTTSALGRSSVYNRLKLGATPYLTPVGYTLGYGHFHLPDEIVTLMRTYLRRRRHPYANAHQYGDGPNWRMRLIREALVMVGRSPSLLKHGIRREVFVCELASNARAALRSAAVTPRYTTLMAAETVAHAAVIRWVLPRAKRDSAYAGWTKAQLLDLMRVPPLPRREDSERAAS